MQLPNHDYEMISVSEIMHRLKFAGMNVSKPFNGYIDPGKVSAAEMDKRGLDRSVIPSLTAETTTSSKQY